jgi:hypothetical protein
MAQVPELLQTCAGNSPTELDLTDLVSADQGGIEALRRIRDAGARLVGAPGYIKLKLDASDELTEFPQPKPRRSPR